MIMLYLDVNVFKLKDGNTADSTERSAMRGSTVNYFVKRHWRSVEVIQKSPLLHGGARVGPHPRDYGFKVNKKCNS